MSSCTEVVVLVEGKTEEIFIQELIMPYLASFGVYIRPVILSKKGNKGGDVKFARAKNDIERHLKQRSDTYLTLFVDFYGIKSDWPGLDVAKQQSAPAEKSKTVNQALLAEVDRLFGECRPDRRLIPYIAMYEFESLLFSDPKILAEHLNVSVSRVEQILAECGEPEAINDSPQTAPSRRLEQLSTRFKKTSTGLAIARSIGLAKIRAACPLFGQWVTSLEQLVDSEMEES